MEIAQGMGSARSAELAVEESNAEGGVLDAAAEVHSVDTRSQPSVAQDEVTRLIDEEQVDLLVGTFTGEVSLSILDTVAESKIPLIVTGAESPRIIEQSTGSVYETYENVFRSGPLNSTYQAEAMADYADFLNQHHGWDTFAYLAEDSQWAAPYTETLPDELRARGYDVVYEGTLSTDFDDYTRVIDSLVYENPDAVFRFFGYITGVELLSLWHQRQPEFGIEGIHVASSNPVFYDATAGTAAYETTAQAGAAGATPLTPHTLEFVEAYQSFVADDDAAPALPMEMGFNTYDAINLYRRAVESAGTADYEARLDDIVDAMLKLEYTGTAGTISFADESGAFPHDVRPVRDGSGRIMNFPVTQWQPDGDLECVYPRAHATADHRRPEWL